MRRAIVPDGVFVVADMVEKNGHQRWPEAKRLAERLFSELPAVLGKPTHDFIMKCPRPAPPPPPLSPKGFATPYTLSPVWRGSHTLATQVRPG